MHDRGLFVCAFCFDCNDASDDDDDYDGANTTVDDRFGLPGPGPEPGLGPGLLYHMHASLLTPAFLVYFGMHLTHVALIPPDISPVVRCGRACWCACLGWVGW